MKRNLFFITIGMKIRNCRRSKGITAVGLGAMISVSKEAIRYYECAEVKIDMSQLRLIAKVLEVDVRSLLPEHIPTDYARHYSI